LPARLDGVESVRTAPRRDGFFSDHGALADGPHGMSEGAKDPGSIDLRPIAATTAVVIGMVATAVVAYLLLDILLLLFIGIVVAAALRPSHVVLCRWGVPKGLAVLLIYLFLLVALVLIALVVGPVLIEQTRTFVDEVPGIYVAARSYLRTSASVPFHFLGQRLPSFERLTRDLTDLAPQLYQGTLGVTTSIVKLPAYFVTVLAIAFYWTMEVPRFERLLLSLLAVERRPRALNVWHEIESRLGGFMRGQGLAMLSIGAASALGYTLIGLPNVLALGVLAGLLEAVPLIGPVLAVGPAVLVAVPLGVHTVLLVIGLAVLLQLIENNVLIPRIMNQAVGVSALVGLLAVLGFGTLYGILGVLIAIPMTAVIQVLLDTMLVNTEPVAEPAGLVGSPWKDLRARVRALRQQARVRLRARTSRMGIDPATADHVVDAVDQQIEVAVARVEQLISAAEETSKPLAVEAKAAIVEKLQDATEQIEQAVEHVDTIAASAEDALATSGPTVAQALAEPSRATKRGEQAVKQIASAVATATQRQAAQEAPPEPIVDNLDRATQRFTDAVQDVETLVVAAQDESRGARTQQRKRPGRD
jgi:predicted PurR-regulated permease PerM